MRLYTSLVCASGRMLKIPPLESAIVVLASPLPLVRVDGLPAAHYGYDALRNGVRLFPDASVQVHGKTKLGKTR